MDNHTTPGTLETADTLQQLAKEAIERITRALEAGELVNLGNINALFAPLRLDVAGLAQLGFAPIATLKAAKLYQATDLPRICAAMVQHLSLIPTPDNVLPGLRIARAHLQNEAAQAVLLPAIRDLMDGAEPHP